MVRTEYGNGDFALAQLAADVDFGYATVGFRRCRNSGSTCRPNGASWRSLPRSQPDRRVHDSIGISLTYAVSERVVIKLEHQDLDTTDVDRVLGAVEIPSVKATIASISVAY